MKLVDDWKQAHRWLSIQIAAVGATLEASWLMVPDAIKENLPAWIGTAVAITAFAGIVAGRLIDQAPKVCDPKKDEP